MKKFKDGDKVECNGNKQARIVRYVSDRMVEVRLMDGSRYVGVVCVDENDIKPLEKPIPMSNMHDFDKLMGGSF